MQIQGIKIKGQVKNLPLMVGVTRLELAAPRPPVWCATTCATPRLLLYNIITLVINQHLNFYIVILFQYLLCYTFLGDFMNDSFSRQQGLLGESGMKRLETVSVIIFGVGGVGSYAAEALARAGVGSITVVDSDVVDITNINRQIIALNSTIGMPKVEVAACRIKDINPLCNVTAIKEFYDESSTIDLTQYDYIIDAIDSVKSKLALAEFASKNNINIICAMGTGNKLEPDKLKISDISKTSYCPLAKKMRVELRKRGIHHLKVVYSTEEPKCRNVPPSSISFVPYVAGLMMAGEVIKHLAEME